MVVQVRSNKQKEQTEIELKNDVDAQLRFTKKCVLFPVKVCKVFQVCRLMCKSSDSKKKKRKKKVPCCYGG